MRSLLMTGVGCALLAGCGLPAGGAPRPVESDRLPPGLEATTAEGGGDPEVQHHLQDGPHTFWVDAEGSVLAATPPVLPGGAEPSAQELLETLAMGPTEQLRSQGVGTALGARPQFDVVAEEAGLADIEVSLGSPPPSADLLPIAIGQIVLTATSAPGVDTVVLSQDGEPLEVPLPGGALTSSPVGPAQYLPLVEGP